MTNLLLSILALVPSGAAEEPEPEPLRLTAPVVCLKVDGYGKYEPRPEPALTSDEKLILYIEPLNHTIDRDRTSGMYHSHLSQSARIRRQGQRSVLWEKQDLGDYKPESERPTRPIFLSTTIALKGLPPGDYEIELTYRDRLREGAEATVTIPFQVKPAPLGAGD